MALEARQVAELTAREVAELRAIEGQPRAVRLLEQALAQDRVGHAWAFVGPRGAGRTTAARAFGRALLCAHRGCGACDDCRRVAAGTHPDLHVFAPTPPESNPRGTPLLRIAAVRELARRASLRPALGRRSVFVLDDADRLTGEAPEALLKTLEEPPGAAVLILVLERARAVPATVLSRCQLVRFAPRAAADPDRPDPREALELLEAVRAGGVAALLGRTAGLDRAGAERLIDALWLLCRDLALVGGGAADAHLVVDPARARAEAHAWTLARLVAAIEACRETRRSLATNVTPRLGVEVLVGRLLGEAA